MKIIIIALGGNAFIKENQKGTMEELHKNLKTPIKQIAELAKTYKIIITHGNGPQVGDLLLQQEATNEVSKMPLEILVAETQGQIGFMIEMTLDEELMELGIDLEKYFITVLTYVEVDPNDSAFKKPTKPIGPSYSEEKPGFVKTTKGWRRVVPSPKPIKIYQWREIKKLLDMDFIVIACGGGGIPVMKFGNKLEGIEAVLDKDLTSSKLGTQVGAEILLIATDVEKVYLNYLKPNQIGLDSITIEEAKKYINEGHFPIGSMGPKIQAAINFLEAGGKTAIITSIEKISASLIRKAGTTIHK